ncbi:MAG: type IV toxin-antitoxin system AbiEi family antitoxin [Candidatus Thorarchaeota archaeon]
MTFVHYYAMFTENVHNHKIYKNGTMMTPKDKEIEVLRDALEMLRRTTGLIIEIQPQPPITQEIPGTYVPDAVIRIAWKDRDWHFAAEVKKMITPATIGLAVQQLDLLRQRGFQEGVLITKYVTPQVADRLKTMNIQFVDAAGNAYINKPPLFIFVKGNKLIDKYRPDRPPRAFQRAGLQVVFALLCNPGLENTPFRKIANVATVALGTVEWVMDDLRRMGCLVDIRKRTRRLIRKVDLLNRWVTIYPEHLKPKLMIGRFTADNFDWWKQADLQEFAAYWGGEVAATVLTEYLKPQIVTIYAYQPVGRLLAKNKLRKHPNGNIEILKAFWNFEHNWLHRKLVHPLLIYADLLAAGDARNIETARIIYEQELTQLIRED